MFTLHISPGSLCSLHPPHREDLKLKDAVKKLGKKFASGASVNESADGKSKEVVIQGDVAMTIPDFLHSEFHVPLNAIFLCVDGKLNPCG